MLLGTSINEETAIKADKTNARFTSLMETHELTRPDAAEVLGVTKGCVDQYLRPKGSPNYRVMRENMLRLFEFELGLREPRYTRVHRGMRK
jgi:hypothetical protein